MTADKGSFWRGAAIFVAGVALGATVCKLLQPSVWTRTSATARQPTITSGSNPPAVNPPGMTDLVPISNAQTGQTSEVVGGVA